MEVVENLAKKCSVCQEVKILSEFNRNKYRSIGYRSECKGCSSSRNKKISSRYTKEQIIESIRNSSKLEGKYFIVLEDLGVINGYTNFKILCDCGKEKILKGYSELNRSKSCNNDECQYRLYHRRTENSIMQETDKYSFFIKKSLWNAYKKKAQQRSLEFSIEPLDILQIWIDQEGKCNRTEISLQAGERNIRGTHTWSINRIDSTRGYTKDNIELVHKYVNLTLNAFDTTSSDLYCMARALKILKSDQEYGNRLKEIIKNDPQKVNELWSEDMKSKSGTNSQKGVYTSLVVTKDNEES